MQYSLYPLSQFGQIYKQLPPFGGKIFMEVTIFTRGRTAKIVDVTRTDESFSYCKNYFSNKAELMDKTLTSRNKGLLAKQ